MSFLAPLFLVGLAGLAIPVLIHLTRNERGKPLSFPSLMFLERIPFRATSRRRLRHLVLLLIRLAALALMVFAFARPFARGGRLAAVEARVPKRSSFSWIARTPWSWPTTGNGACQWPDRS